MNIFEFMSDSPILTFFLVAVVVDALVYIIRGRGEDK
jgi:hypothetical protein